MFPLETTFLTSLFKVPSGLYMYLDNVEKLLNGWKDGWMGGWVGGHMDRWMDRWISFAWEGQSISAVKSHYSLRPFSK